MTRELRMSDDTIAQIAKLLQVAMLTGTDIVDHLRMVRVVIQEDQVVPSESYKALFEEQLEKLQQEALAAREAVDDSEAH